MIITKGLGGITRGYGNWILTKLREVLRLNSFIHRTLNLVSRIGNGN